MTDTPFNTLAMMRQLETKGFTTEQAEAVTEAVRTGVTGGVATKADLAEVRADLAEFKAEVRAALKWMKAIGGAIVALLAVPLLRDLIMALNGIAP